MQTPQGASSHLRGADDLATATLVGNHLLTASGRPVTAVFFDAAMAAVYRGAPGVEAVAWGPQLAGRITRELPPSPLNAVAPPPILVGDAPIARLVAMAWVRGWAEPGQRLLVHCIGGDGTMAREVLEETRPDGRITWTESALRPGPVVRQVLDLVDGWDRPKPKHGTPTGPTVVVATHDEAATVMVAAAIAREVPEARVAAVVSGETHWPEIPGLRMFSLAEAMTVEAARRRASVEELAQLIGAESAWLAAPDAEATAPEAPLFEGFRYEGAVPADWADQPAAAREAVSHVADGIERILAAGGMRLAVAPVQGAQPIILDPDELAAMADEILTLLGLTPNEQLRLTALELAYRLPVLASQAGFFPLRADGYQQLLNHDSVKAMALRVHLVYNQISAETDNATGSALAGALWSQLSDFYKASNRAAVTGAAIAHAALGISWQRATQQELPELDDIVEQLAELEHRRWAINMRGNGRGDHGWAIPWRDVTEATRDYDRAIVRAIPEILRLADVAVLRTR